MRSKIISETQPDPRARVTGKKRIFFAAIMIVLLLLALEGLVRVAARAGLVNIRTFAVSNEVTRITFVGNLDPFFGVWHLPLARVQVPTPEGEVIYETNAQGMRDRSREFSSGARERVVVLGDSFVEGCYVAASNRFTDLLEQKTGIQFLNFGTSGGFGSIQEWQLYEHLARQFDHTRVLLFLLPDNDFADNDPVRHADRYQPALQKNNGTYTVTYPSPFRPELTRETRIKGGRAVRHRCYNHWLTMNLLVTFDYERLRILNTSSYDGYTDEDMNQLLFTYAQILKDAEPRPLTIYIIPRDRDFIAFAAGKFRNRLTAELSEWASRRKGVKVVDLLPGFLAYMKAHNTPAKDFFLSFDPHWSPLGHQVAADLVLASQPGLFPEAP